MAARNGWIGVDLDGTLAEHVRDMETIGKPVESMLARVKQWLTDGKRVRIFSARFCFPDSQWDQKQKKLLSSWCMEHGLPSSLANSATATKDPQCIAIYDDRAVAIQRDTGFALSPEPVDLVLRNGVR